MSERTEPPFKITWPRHAIDAEDDLDLKRPGQVDGRTADRVSRGAIGGPPARPVSLATVLRTARRVRRAR